MATKKENEVFTFRVRPDGDGRFFVGAKYNEAGEEVEVVTQRHMSEPDAEKELRGIVSGNDVIAVERMHSVDKDDNTHVVFETSAPEDTKKFGATIKYADTAARPTSDDMPTPADMAVSEGKVAEVKSAEEPSEAEKKAQDAVAKKVAAREEKEDKEA